MMKKIYIAHSTKYNFQKYLYEPIKRSQFYNDFKFILPHDSSEWINSKEIIKGCDLVIAEVSLQTTGTGIEMGWANAFDISIICIYKKGVDPGRSINAVSRINAEYDDENLVTILSKLLDKYRK